MTVNMWLFSAMGLGVVSLGFAFYLYAWVSRQDAGGAREQQIAGYIQEGARAYLSKLYGALAKLVAVLAVVIALVFSLDMLESVKAGQLVGSTNPLEGVLTAIAFVVGAGCSGLAGFLGMSIAVLQSGVLRGRGAGNGHGWLCGYRNFDDLSADVRPGNRPRLLARCVRYGPAC
jgi:K(+)-stimulated pyrophosphate-energized sodium pump